MIKDTIEYHSNGVIKKQISYYTNSLAKQCEMNFNEQEEKHGENGEPWYIRWHENGIIEIEAYRVHGKFHNTKGPAIIYYDEDGRIEHIGFFLNDKEYLDKELTDNWVEYCDMLEKLEIFQ